MALPNKKDLRITKDGDLETTIRTVNGETLKDFSLISDQPQVLQSIDVRLKSQIKDFLIHPTIGSRLNEIIGMRSTRETAELGKNYIIEAIVRQNYITREYIDVSYIPLPGSKITYIIKIETSESTFFSLVLELDLKNGIRRVI